MDTMLPPLAPDFDPGMMAGPDPDEIGKLLDSMLDAFESDAEERMTPLYPAWFDAEAADKAKPNPDELLAKSKRAWDDFSQLRNRFRDTLRFLSPGRRTTFSDASPFERANAFHDSTPELEVELLVAQVAGIDPTYMPTCRTRDEYAGSAEKADFLYACHDDAERRHVATGHGDLKAEVVRTEAIYGRLAAMVLYNTDADYDEMPVVTSLIDPATCAPVYDTHGMSEMHRVYRATIAEACSAFGAEERVKSRILNPKGRAAKQEHHDCEVREAWTRWWRVVWIDGHLVLGPVAHKLGYPPFAYQMGSLGAPSYIQDLPGAAVYAASASEAERYGTSTWTGRNPVANPSRGVSHIDIMKYPIQLREAIQSRVLTQFRREVDPPLIVEQNIIAADKGVPEIGREANDISPIEMGNEQINALPIAPNPATLGPLMNQVNEVLGRALFSSAAYGINSNSNVSGFAVENLAEHGRDKLLPHLVTIEAFYRQVAEMQLRLFRDWGWVLKQGDSPRGRFQIPRHRVGPEQDPMFELRPDDLRTSGTQVKVKMTSVRLTSLGNVANAISIVRNMGLMPDRRALELLGDPNPDRTIIELEAEAARKAAQAPQGPSPGPPGIPGMPGPSDSPVGIQGASLPGFGMPPGPGSGPQGPLSPPTPFDL